MLKALSWFMNLLVELDYFLINGLCFDPSL